MLSLKERGLGRNINLLKLLKGFQYLLFLLPVLVPFYNAVGLSNGQIIYLQAIFAISIFVFEIPTGYISDKFSRRLSIQIGYFCCAFAYLMYGFEGGFWYWAMLQCLVGFGSCCISGSNDALMYDSLLSMGKSHEYVKHKSSMSSVGNFMEAFAGIVGGLVGVLSLIYAAYLQGVAFMIGGILALFLVEPMINRDMIGKSHVGEMKRALKIVFVEKRAILWVLVYSAMIGGMTFSSVWLFQPVLVNNGVGIGLFGWFWAAMNFSVGLGVLTLPWFQKNFSLKSLFLIMPFIGGIGLIAVGVWGSVLSLMFYMLVTWVRAINGVMISFLLNERVGTDLRATILSMDSMLFRGFFALVAPILGFVLDVYSLQIGFLLVAVVFGVGAMIPYIKLKKYYVV